MIKTILAGLAGVAAGFALAAWTETMIDSNSNEPDLEVDTVSETENDESLKESGANA
jgi:hypothetical protein